MTAKKFQKQSMFIIVSINKSHNMDHNFLSLGLQTKPCQSLSTIVKSDPMHVTSAVERRPSQILASAAQATSSPLAVTLFPPAPPYANETFIRYAVV